MDERVKREYEKWLAVDNLDAELREELEGLAGQDEEIRERFYEDIKFGTGGIRGIIGAGTSRMNIYTVSKATQGLAQAILAARAAEGKVTSSGGSDVVGQDASQAANRVAAQDESQNADQETASVTGDGGDDAGQDAVAPPAVVIAYDCRHKSRYFAELAAGVLAANGIKAFVFEELTPTPILSFAVRELGAAAGIVITASHNPPAYNGYKAYWSDGAQVVTEIAEDIMTRIEAVDDIFNVPRLSPTDAEAAGLLEWLQPSGKVMWAYYMQVQKLVNRPQMQVGSRQTGSGATGSPTKSSSHDSPGSSAAAQEPSQMGQDSAGLDKKSTQAASQPDSSLRIVYTPLHGVAYKPMQAVMEQAGYGPDKLFMVQEQTIPDPNFSTVKSPNPEDPEAYELALKYALDHDADVIIATDPDGDRLGLMAKLDPAKPAQSAADYKLISGNQLGALLFDRILSQRIKYHKRDVEYKLRNEILARKAADRGERDFSPHPLDEGFEAEPYLKEISLEDLQESFEPPYNPDLGPNPHTAEQTRISYKNGYMIKTIVSSDLTGAMARAHDVYTEDTLTGFKHIAERVEYFNNHVYWPGIDPNPYVFGFEESFGYMPADFVRDKDGIQSALLAVELAQHYKESGRGLWQGLEDIYQTYGYYQDALINVVLEGLAGQERIAAMMNDLRQSPLRELAGIPIKLVKDYLEEGTGLPPSNVLKYYLTDGSWFAMRPSGTEPKLKFYFSTNDIYEDKSIAKLDKLMAAVREHFKL